MLRSAKEREGGGEREKLMNIIYFKVCKRWAVEVFRQKTEYELEMWTFQRKINEDKKVFGVRCTDMKRIT